MANTANTWFSKEQLFELLKADNVKSVSPQTIQKAQTGDAVELYNIGSVYEVDRKEFAKALGFYFLAAELNYSKAIEAIGKMYEKGRGVPVHYHVALEWYIKAAKHNSPHSYILIGSMFLNGLGVKTDIVKAQEWFHKQKLSVQNDKFRIVLSKEQKSKIQRNSEMSDTHLIHHACYIDKSVETLIRETEEILHYQVYSLFTFDTYKQMKNAELGLVDHIKAFQNSNAMCINTNNNLSAQVELLVKNKNSPKSTLATNTATAKNEKNDSEKAYTQSQAELKRVDELENENNQLFCIIANERLKQKGPNQPNTRIEKKIEKERERLEQEKGQQEKSDKEKPEQERTKYKDELEQEREKYKDELDKERANHKKAMEHLKEQNKATVDALRSTNKKNYAREREVHEKQIERHRDVLKREIEKEKTQAHKLKAAQTQHKNAQQDMKRQIGHLQEQLSGLEEQKGQYFTVMNHVRTENAQLKKRLSERQDKNQDSLQLLSNSYNSFEQEKANLDALIRFMQSTRDNMHQSSLEMKNALASAGAGHAVHVELKKPVVVHHSVLTQSALHLREELERESEMRRKRRRGSSSIQDDQ